MYSFYLHLLYFLHYYKNWVVSLFPLLYDFFDGGNEIEIISQSVFIMKVQNKKVPIIYKFSLVHQLSTQNWSNIQ